MSEALERLRDAVKGRAVVDQRQGRMVSCAFAEVACADILEISAAVASPSGRVRALVQGNQGASEGSQVHCKVTDLCHLIESAEASMPARGQPSVNDD